MGARTSYKTKHRDEILEILQENEREHMTAGQILDELKARGVSIGVATIYRQLDRLVEEGAVNKYMVDAVTGACYEFRDGHEEKSAYVHGKCEKCGKVVHIEQGFSGGGFELDCTRTLFYGICEDCRRTK